MAPGNRNRGRLDDVALDPALDKQAMNPKAVQASLLNDHNLHRDAMALLGLRLQARKKDEQRSTVTALNDMLGKLLLARTVGGHQPLRLAQFERGEQRVRVISDGGLDSGCGGLGLHRGLHAGVWKLSLPTQATVHPHRIFFSTTLSRDFEMCSPVRRSISSCRRGRVQFARSATSGAKTCSITDNAACALAAAGPAALRARNPATPLRPKIHRQCRTLSGRTPNAAAIRSLVYPSNDNRMARAKARNSSRCSALAEIHDWLDT